MIKKSELVLKNNQIYLINTENESNKITLLFDRNNFNLTGWEIEDQFKNNIVFLIEILSINEDINLKKFEIPS